MESIDAIDTVFQEERSVEESGELEAFFDERGRGSGDEERGEILAESQARESVDEPMVVVVMPGEGEEDRFGDGRFFAKGDFGKFPEVFRVCHDTDRGQGFIDEESVQGVEAGRERDIDLVCGEEGGRTSEFFLRRRVLEFGEVGGGKGRVRVEVRGVGRDRRGGEEAGDGDVWVRLLEERNGAEERIFFCDHDLSQGRHEDVRVEDFCGLEGRESDDFFCEAGEKCAKLHGIGRGGERIRKFLGRGPEEGFRRGEPCGRRSKWA